MKIKKDIPMAQDTSNDVSWAFVIHHGLMEPEPCSYHPLPLP